MPTFLGAHEIPLEHRELGRARDASTSRSSIHEMIPAVAAERLARFADVFCETGVYTVDESRAHSHRGARRRTAAQAPRRRADLVRRRGARRVARRDVGRSSRGDLGCRHRRAGAAARTVATLLRGRCSFSARRKHAPARRLIEAGVPVALATDFNPGTSPTPNLPLVLTLGVSQLHLSVAEAVIAATVNGAAALALADRVGQIAPGFSADLALFDVRGRSRAAILVRRQPLRGDVRAGQTLSHE